MVEGGLGRLGFRLTYGFLSLCGAEGRRSVFYGLLGYTSSERRFRERVGKGVRQRKGGGLVSAWLGLVLR